MNKLPENSDTSEKAVANDALLALLDSEIAQARDRQFHLTRDAEIATVKNQIVGEYRFRFMDLRDKLSAKISEANARGMAPGSAVPDSESTNELGR